MRIPAPTVLIGEPDPFNLSVLEEACRAAGFDAAAAIDGSELLAHAARRPPALVLVASTLSDPDALEVLRILRDDDALDTTPVVLATASESEQRRAIELGAIGVVARPYVVREVESRMIQAVRVARDRRRARRASVPMVPVESSDDATGCGTRAQLLLTLEYEITRAERFGHALSCVVVQTAQAALGDLAEGLRRTLRAMDGLFRSGPAELTAVLPETDGRGAAVVTRRIRERATDAAIFGRCASSGVRVASATVPSPSYGTPDEMLDAARRALA